MQGLCLTKESQQLKGCVEISGLFLEEGYLMSKKKICRWYDQTSGMKRAYDQGKLDIR